MIRKSFFDTLVFLSGIYFIENHFGNLSIAMAQFSSIAIAFAPVVVMIMGLMFIVSSVWK